MYFTYYKSLKNQPVKNAIINELYKTLEFPDCVRLLQFNVSIITIDDNKTETFKFGKNIENVKKFLKSCEADEMLIIVHNRTKDDDFKLTTFENKNNTSSIYLPDKYAFIGRAYPENREKLKEILSNLNLIDKENEDSDYLLLADYALYDSEITKKLFTSGGIEGVIIKLNNYFNEKIENLSFFSNMNHMRIEKNSKFFSVTSALGIKELNTQGSIVRIENDEIKVIENILPRYTTTFQSKSGISGLGTDKKTTGIIPYSNTQYKQHTHYASTNDYTQYKTKDYKNKLTFQKVIFKIKK